MVEEYGRVGHPKPMELCTVSQMICEGYATHPVTSVSAGGCTVGGYAAAWVHERGLCLD